MALNYTNDIMALFAAKIAADANYQSPGNFGLSNTEVGSVGVGSVAVGGVNNAYTAIPTVTSNTGGSTFSVLMNIANITRVGAAGSGYAPADTITLGGGVVTVATAKLVGLTPVVAGSGYAAGDTLIVTGGTSSQAAIGSVATTKLVSTAINARGTSYLPLDTVTTTGGTFSIAAVITVTAVRLLAAGITVAAGGTGYGNAQTFNVTLVGGTGTAAVVNVTGTAGGVVNTINSVTTPGSYTVVPGPNPIATTAPSGGGSGGTGLTFNFTAAVWAIDTISITTPGSYTVNSAALTQGSTTSVAGTGATFQTSLYGVLTTGAVGTPGNYTVLPANPVATTSGGTGTLATFTAAWGVLSATVSTPGSYAVLSANPVAQTASSGPGLGATFNLTYSVLSVGVVAGGAYVSVAPTLTVSAGNATAIATLAVLSQANTDEQKLLMLVEVIRSLCAEMTNIEQAKDVHETLRKMLARMKFGGGTFTKATLATSIQKAALNYIAKAIRPTAI